MQSFAIALNAIAMMMMITFRWLSAGTAAATAFEAITIAQLTIVSAGASIVVI